VRDEHWSHAVTLGGPRQFLLLTFYFLLLSRAGRLRCGNKVKVYTSVFAGKNDVLRPENSRFWEEKAERQGT
jgi:hypothetical protein